MWLWWFFATLLTPMVVRCKDFVELPDSSGDYSGDLTIEIGEEKVLDILATINVVREEIVLMNNRHNSEMKEIRNLLKSLLKNSCTSTCPTDKFTTELPTTTESPSTLPPPITGSNNPKRHCSDLLKYHQVKESGVYQINLPTGDPLDVYCDMTTDNGGWTLVQRRMSGKVNFTQDWLSYRDGFGDLTDEFWLGNEVIHLLTQRADPMELRVDLMGCDNRKAYEIYRTFAVESEVTGYRLIVDSPYGTAGRALDTQNGTKFSTYDRDNDHLPTHNCAQYYNGFWYFACGFARLNGRHYMSDCSDKPNGILWFPWNKRKSRFYSARKVEMKIRPRHFYVI